MWLKLNANTQAYASLYKYACAALVAADLVVGNQNEWKIKMVHQMDDKMLDALSAMLKEITTAKWPMTACQRDGLRRFRPSYIDFVKKLFCSYPTVYPATATGFKMILKKRVFLGHFFIERKGTVEEWYKQMGLTIDECKSGEYVPKSEN